MCALLPLLAVAVTVVGATLPPPALLVLRVACAARDPAAFDGSRLERHARARRPPLARPLQLLDYQSTCGPDWRLTVTRDALSTLVAGGAVACAGWPGWGACEALAAAGRLLKRPQPAVCALGFARGAVVAALAARLRWRRALVPAGAPRSECEAALREVRRALAAAGLLLGGSLTPDDVSAPQPQVVIMCASRHAVAAARLRSTLESLLGGRPGATVRAPRPALLLLQVDELDTATLADTPPPQVPHTTSNITLNVGRRLRVVSRAVKSSSGVLPEHIVHGGFNSSLMTSNESAEHRSTSALYDYSGERLKNDTAENKGKPYFKNRVERGGKSRWLRSASAAKVGTRNPFLREIDEELPLKLLLLSHNHLGMHRGPFDHVITYESILQEVERTTHAEAVRHQVEHQKFWLFERSEDRQISPWSQIAVIESVSARSLDDSGEWATDVILENASHSLERWSQVRTDRNAEDDRVDVLVLVLAVGAAVGAMGGAGLAGRWAAGRRRRRRRLGDAVLSPADFSFPSDEQRRVGEGMETMLSCWLQQLHEFGGPELERPDLLKQPPRVTHAPSAPSSTCSINRVPLDRRTRYKGDAVHVKYLPVIGSLELKRKTTDVLLLMQSLRHENINPFIGCLCEVRPALVFDHCGRGSLEDVLMADDIKLDWTFRLSLLTDLVKGMRYLHASALRVHGRLTSRNCVVDSRWVLRVTDYATQAFYHAQNLPEPERTSRDLLWMAPELLREMCNGGGGGGEGVRGSQPGDVFSFAIVMQEVIVRGEPYCMLALTPDEIVEKLRRPPPLIRPSVSMGAAPPEAVSIMRQCWAEAPEHRPDFHRLHDIFRHLHKGRKINIVDSMFEMLEKYSNNLEELIRERTEQLDMEKKKTEQLLNRMLPRSVAERLLLGSRVEPEEFEEVSIYFSDIVGFTALAARSTPVQVVDLLNDLYTTFDAAIQQYRVYKVETIGDAYMVVGGLPVRTRDHAESVATMALHLLHLAGRFRVRHLPDTPLHLRIGLHSGPCCAAVVGLTMPRYCLFGDTVNTASRMESTGAAWRIQVSAATAERLTAAGGYRLRSRGLTQVKGKGAMHTYWLLGKDGFDKPLPTPPPLESEEVLFETDGENDSEESSAPTSTPRRNSPCAEGTGLPLTRDRLSAGCRSRSHIGSDIVPFGDRRDCERPTDSEMALSRLGGGVGVEGRTAWRRSGAASADSSPPRASHVQLAHTRYRCLAGGARALRRQWSLERGEALAEAAAGVPSTLEPLALLAVGPGGSRAPTPRYRTRRDVPDEEAARFFS